MCFADNIKENKIGKVRIIKIFKIVFLLNLLKSKKILNSDEIWNICPKLEDLKNKPYKFIISPIPANLKCSHSSDLAKKYCFLNISIGTPKW